MKPRKRAIDFNFFFFKNVKFAFDFFVYPNSAEVMFGEGKKRGKKG